MRHLVSPKERLRANYDGAVLELIQICEDIVVETYDLLYCATGSRFPRLHILAMHLIIKTALIILWMRREPRSASKPAGKGRKG